MARMTRINRTLKNLLMGGAPAYNDTLLNTTNVTKKALTNVKILNHKLSFLFFFQQFLIVNTNEWEVNKEGSNCTDKSN